MFGEALILCKYYHLKLPSDKMLAKHTIMLYNFICINNELREEHAFFRS
jgi:hypothetical protein